MCLPSVRIDFDRSVSYVTPIIATHFMNERVAIPFKHHHQSTTTDLNEWFCRIGFQRWLRNATPGLTVAHETYVEYISDLVGFRANRPFIILAMRESVRLCLATEKKNWTCVNEWIWPVQFSIIFGNLKCEMQVSIIFSHHYGPDNSGPAGMFDEWKDNEWEIWGSIQFSAGNGL